jgi:phage tail sheath protein FI
MRPCLAVRGLTYVACASGPQKHYVPDPGGPAPFSDVRTGVWRKAAEYCKQRRAVLLVDAPRDWTVQEAVKDSISHVLPPSENAAMYFPWLVQGDTPRPGARRRYPPAASVAGVIARTDATRGVWKAPAGPDAWVDATEPSVPVRDLENGELNPLGISCLRTMPAAGTVVWGATGRPRA